MESNKILGTIYLAIALALIVLLTTGLRGRFDDKLASLSLISREDWDDDTTGSTEKSVDYTEQEIHSVDAELISLSLRIGRSDDRKIHVELFDKAVDACRVLNRNGKLSLKEIKKKSGDGKVLVSLPASWKGDLEVESASGSVHIEDVNPDSVDIEAVSGSIQLKDCNSPKLEVEAVSGSVKADGVFEKVRVETVSGSISVSTTSPLKNKSSFESLSGSITLALPRSNGYTLSFDSMSGSFTDSITGVNGKKKVESVNGNGKVSISASTVSGSMKVNGTSD